MKGGEKDLCYGSWVIGCCLELYGGPPRLFEWDLTNPIAVLLDIKSTSGKGVMRILLLFCAVFLLSFPAHSSPTIYKSS